MDLKSMKRLSTSVLLFKALHIDKIPNDWETGKIAPVFTNIEKVPQGIAYQTYLP